MRKSRKQLLCSALALSVAISSVFGIAPVTTKAQTTEVTVESQQVAAEEEIIIHAKGSGLNIYAWKDKDEQFGAWPGKAMEADSVMGSGWVTATVKAGYKFIVNGNGGQSDDLSADAGEYWYVDGKLSPTNPEGPTPVPTEAPTPTPEPILVSEITPEDGTELQAGTEQEISVNASTSIDDGTLYYKYEVKCDGNYVGDHYYSKSSTYKFTPEADKTYNVKISIQAHDEENTTVTKEVTYKGSENGAIVTAGPATPTPEPTATPDPSGSGDDEKATPTPTVPAGKQTPTPKPTKTPVPDGTSTPPASADPDATATPTVKPTVTPTQKPPIDHGGDVTPKPTPTVKPTSTPDNSGGNSSGFDPELSVKLKASKSSPQKAGSSITLSASSEGTEGKTQYMFYYKKSGTSKNVIIQKYSTKSTCTWKPKENGTYTLYVKVKDSTNLTATAKVSSYKIKGLTLSVSTNKKSPQKKKTSIQITAKTANGSGKVKYQFIVKLGSKVEKKTSYGSSKKFTWKPKKKGTYTLYVKAKDSVTEVTKKCTFKIK